MRRSISYVEPNIILAGETGTWKFIFSPAATLKKGAKLKFDLSSKGRYTDWQLPETDHAQSDNCITAIMENGKILPAKEIPLPGNVCPQYEFTLPAELEAGEQFTIQIGTPPGKKTKKAGGNMSQQNAQRRRPFYLFIDPTGKGNYEEPELFTMDIRGNELKNISIITPSYVIKNKRFDVILRFEDEYGNLTNHAPEDTLIELSYENLRENLKWKLFVPETGFISLPNLYFNEEGFYTITLKNLKTGEEFKSAPIRCFNEGQELLLWGQLHGESERYDSGDNIESCLRYFRDDKAYNFYGISSPEDADETSNEQWKLISQNVVDFNEEDRFTTFLGFQWTGERQTEGVRLFVYPKDGKPILRKKDAKNSSLKKIYKGHAPKDFISIPCWTMAKGAEYDFSNFDPEFERVVEIYNSWGCSETTAKEGNPIPIEGPGKTGVKETGEGSIIKALMQNNRFGFVAGGLDDRGIYQELYDNEQQQYPAGLTAIVSKEHTRQTLFDALYNRSCYATTGKQIIVGLSIAGVPMGGQTSTAEKPGLSVNRHIAGFVAGTCGLHTIEIIRNGEVIHTIEPSGYHHTFTFDDLVPLSSIAIKPKDKNLPFAFYYLRIMQEDGHMAWSSPIWVDDSPPEAVKQLRKVQKAQIVKKELSKPLADEEEEEEEEFSKLDEEYSEFED